MRPQYEYQVIEVDWNWPALLNKLGAEGWRLVHTYQSMGYTTQLIFERAKAPEGDDG